MAGENEGAVEGAAKTALSIEQGSAAEAADAGKTGEVEAAKGEAEKTGAAEGTKGEQGKDGKADAPKLHGAPNEYVAFKMPENVEADAALIEKATPLLKEFNLSQDGAQKAVDFITELRQADAAAFTEASTQVWNDLVDGWEKTAKEDTEIGGQNYDTAKANGLKTVHAFFKKPEELTAWTEFVSTTGVGNHPVLRKLLARIGADIKEDGVPARGGHGEPAKTPLENRLYTSMASDKDA